MASPWRAVLTAVSAVLLAASLMGGTYVVAGVIAVLSGVFAWGWPVLIEAPAARSSSLVIVAAALASVILVLMDESPVYLSLVLAFGVIGAFIQQMARTDGRHDVVNAVSATVTGVVVVTSASGWLLGMYDYAGEETLIAALAILAVASVVTAFPVPTMLVAGIAALLGAGVGMGISTIMPHVSLVSGAILGLVVGGMMALSHVVIGSFPITNRWSAAAGAALLPVLVLGVPVHLVAALAA